MAANDWTRDIASLTGGTIYGITGYTTFFKSLFARAFVQPYNYYDLILALSFISSALAVILILRDMVDGRFWSKWEKMKAKGLNMVRDVIPKGVISYLREVPDFCTKPNSTSLFIWREISGMERSMDSVRSDSVHGWLDNELSMWIRALCENTENGVEYEDTISSLLVIYNNNLINMKNYALYRQEKRP